MVGTRMPPEAPAPTAPFLLRPQHWTSPESRRAQAWSPPTEDMTGAWMPVLTRGALTMYPAEGLRRPRGALATV